MIHFVLLSGSFICLLVTVYLFIVTVERCQSKKRYFFIYFLSALFLFLLGHILELMAPNADAALAGIKVLYAGSTLMTPLFLLFVIDYCEVDLPNRYIKPLILVLPVIAQGFIWTVGLHTFFYREYHHSIDEPHLGLQVVPGMFYNVINAYSFVYVAITCLILGNRMIKWEKSHRSALLLFMLASITPLIAQALYLLFTFEIDTPFGGISFLPYSMVITNTLLYINVIRYDIFDFAPQAQSMSFDLLWDAVIITDSDLRYYNSNRRAKAIFPDLDSLRKGMPITRMQNWPRELVGIVDGSDVVQVDFSISGENDRFYLAHVGNIAAKKVILGYTIVIRDVTETTMLMNKLREAAYTDALTTLFNRRHFFEIATVQFARLERENSPACAMMIDIDFFKKCNDKYGHQAGDEVLRTVALQIKKEVRSYDTLCRYGGEEFAVFAPNVDENVAMQIAERIRKRVGETPSVYKETRIMVTCSIGIAARVDGESLEELLNHADKALYLAKEQGRNRCVYMVNHGRRLV